MQEPAPEASKIWTIPNAICVARFFGSFVLLPLAYYGAETPFIIAVALLFFSDWIDGKLAIWLNQKSAIGARIDSVADATYYALTGIGITWIKWPEMPEIAWWIAAALASYALTMLFAYFKYGRFPAYHTYGAKASNWFMLAGMIAWFLWDQPWPLRLALAGVVLTNLETTAMTWLLPTWRADVPTLWHARRLYSSASPRGTSN